MFAPMVLDSSNKGDECASAHTLGKDFTLAVSIAAEEFANRESKLNALTTTWHVAYTAVVIAVHC